MKEFENDVKDIVYLRMMETSQKTEFWKGDTVLELFVKTQMEANSRN